MGRLLLLMGLLFILGCDGSSEKEVNQDKVEVTSKESVDIIIKNGNILTMNSDKEIIESGVLVVKDNKILALGGEELLDKYQGEKVLDADGGIVMPGMINTHTHAAMTVFRSLADDVPDRLNRYIFPLENQMVSPELVYTGTYYAGLEMIRGGVTTLVDMYLYEDSAAKAIKDLGLRGIMGQNIIKYPTADGEDGKAKIDLAIKLVEKYSGDELITPAFAPHAPHTMTKEDLLEVAKLSKQYNVPVLMHVAETKKELEKFLSEEGMTPVEYLDTVGLLNERLIAAHLIFVNDSDINLMEQNGVGVAHNMVANIKSAKGVSPALKMYDNNLRIGLGTDGPMSGNTLDIIGQMGYVAKVHKLEGKDRSLMPPEKVVDMATMGGARAIHREKELGSLEVGKLADVVVIETKSPNMNPIYNYYSALVYSANAQNVDSVIVNGKLLMEAKQLIGVDEAQAREKLLELTDEINEVAKEL